MSNEDLSGVGYFIPITIVKFQVEKWELKMLTYARHGDNIQHIDWWESDLIMELLQTFNITVNIVTFNDIKLRYTGLPRIRTKSFKYDNVFKYEVFNGCNLNNEMKSLIYHHFGDDVKMTYEDHEVMDNDDKEVIQFVLNLAESAY
jgi:hypothetical protein